MVEPSLEILDVTFLTPALVHLKTNGQKLSIHASIDIVNRKVYVDGLELYSEEVFGYLDANTLPEDFYAAPPDVMERAAEVWEDQRKLQQQHMGE